MRCYWDFPVCFHGGEWILLPSVAGDRGAYLHVAAEGKHEWCSEEQLKVCCWQNDGVAGRSTGIVKSGAEGGFLQQPLAFKRVIYLSVMLQRHTDALSYRKRQAADAKRTLFSNYQIRLAQSGGSLWDGGVTFHRWKKYTYIELESAD